MNEIKTKVETLLKSNNIEPPITIKKRYYNHKVDGGQRRKINN
jgi:myb-related protein